MLHFLTLITTGKLPYLLLTDRCSQVYTVGPATTGWWLTQSQVCGTECRGWFSMGHTLGFATSTMDSTAKVSYFLRNSSFCGELCSPNTVHCNWPENFSQPLKNPQKETMKVSPHTVSRGRGDVRQPFSQPALSEVSTLNGCQAVFYVWSFKQAFSLQNVLAAQLDQHIWEPAQEDADNIWISKALHIKICLNTED